MNYNYRRTAFLSPILCIFLAAQLSSSIPARAEPLKIKTEQQMVEDLLKPSGLDVSNPVAVFAAVFEALPDKVTVYPTESYYYFTFPHRGIIYAGNMRFDAFDQFDGKVHFAYNPEYALWRKAEEPTYKKLGAEESVKVVQVDKFTYTITFKGKTVEFDIPDMSNVKPKEGIIRADETYLGPIWDESGVRFFLLFNNTAKTFLYLLNDDPKMDLYEPSDLSPGLTVGNRTSFSFLKDKLVPERQILIGVFAGNTQVNNYFDGPFDQLPDNYIEGNKLRDAILKLVPDVKDKVDRYGSLPDGAERFAITSYKYYEDVRDLKPIIDCAAKNNEPAQYYACFDIQQDENSGPPSEITQSDASKDSNAPQKPN